MLKKSKRLSRYKLLAALLFNKAKTAGRKANRLQGSNLHQGYIPDFKVLGEPWCLCALVAFFVFRFLRGDSKLESISYLRVFTTAKNSPRFTNLYRSPFGYSNNKY